MTKTVKIVSLQLTNDTLVSDHVNYITIYDKKKEISSHMQNTITTYRAVTMFHSAEINLSETHVVGKVQRTSILVTFPAGVYSRQ